MIPATDTLLANSDLPDFSDTCVKFRVLTLEPRERFQANVRFFIDSRVAEHFRHLITPRPGEMDRKPDKHDIGNLRRTLTYTCMTFGLPTVRSGVRFGAQVKILKKYRELPVGFDPQSRIKSTGTPTNSTLAISSSSRGTYNKFGLHTPKPGVRFGANMKWFREYGLPVADDPKKVVIPTEAPTTQIPETSALPPVHVCDISSPNSQTQREVLGESGIIPRI